MNISIIYDGISAICKIDNKDFTDCSKLDKLFAIEAFNIIKKQSGI